MTDLMARTKKNPTSEPLPRMRLIIDTEEIVRQALSLRALKLGVKYRREVSKSEAATEILRRALADEISELQSSGK